MCEFLQIPAAIGAGYLIGSIPIGYIIVKLRSGKDIRDSGSGSIGGTNVSRLLGLKIGAIVSLLDISKGFLAFLIGHWINPHSCGIISAFMAVVGHCFPVFIGFRGGKGVSTALGSAIAIATLPSLFALAVFSYALVISRRVSTGSLIGVWSFSAFCFIFDSALLPKLISIALALFITWTHRQNISRTFKGEENPIF